MIIYPEQSNLFNNDEVYAEIYARLLQAYRTKDVRLLCEMLETSMNYDVSVEYLDSLGKFNVFHD